MKTKTPLFYLWSFIFYLLLSPMPCALSQIPQGFNYQAIARDGSGNILPNTSLQAMLYIQSESTGGTIFWKELHGSVMTNSFGLFTLVVGTGARQTESTVATFDRIDWSVTPKYLKTEIYYSGSWKDMGTSQLLTVPYAMVAEDLAGSVKKLAVEGETAGLEEALFEVKNKDGQTVFAVYNEGVRVYVSNGAKALKGGFAVGGFGTDKAESTKYLFVGKDSVRIYLDSNPLTKGIKSGFAVGGYDLTKGTVQNFLDVSGDSVRIYIDSDPDTKKLKGGFAVGGYDMTKGINTNYMNVNTDASGIINPSQNRILWYPLKNSFLTGRVLIEYKDSVGENSFASGYESKAKGMYSQALGYKAIARGDYSTAIGKNAVADSINSFAFGEDAAAKNDESYAFGRGAVASGYRSFAFGSAGVDSAGVETGVAYAKGDYSFAIGQGSQALGKGAFAIGLADTAKGRYSIAIGYKNRSQTFYSTAIGGYTTASGLGSTSIGLQSNSSGEGSVAIGIATTASGNYSTATGIYTAASGEGSIAMGMATTAFGEGSIAMGYNLIAQGANSIAMGYETYASGDYSTAMGFSTTASEQFSTAMGYETIASGLGSTATGAHTTASGQYSTAMGLSSKSSGLRSTALGYKATAVGNYSIAMGYETIASHYSTTTGYRSKASGYGSTAMGYGTVANTAYMTALGIYNDTTKYHGESSYTGFFNDDPLLVIGKGTSDNSRFNAVTVLKNGNVGIGTVSPSYLLDVNGNSRINGSIQIGNSSGPITPNWWEFGIDNGGISGIDFHTSSSATDYSARILRGGGDNGNFDLINLGSGNLALYAQNGNLNFFTQNINRMSISSAGNLGVGTSSPLNKLSIAGTRSNTINSANAIASIGGGDVFTYFGALDGTPNWNTWIQPLRSTDNYPFGLSLCPLGGNVGIGTTNSPYVFYVYGAPAGHIATIRNDGNTTSNHGLAIACGPYTSGATAVNAISFYDGDFTGVGSIQIKNGTTLYNTTSDISLKTEIVPTLIDGITIVKNMPVVDFEFREIPGKTLTGFIAQDIEKVYPDAVSEGQDGILQLSLPALVPILTKAIQEQQQQIETQNQKIEQLSKIISNMQGEIASLRSQ